MIPEFRIKEIVLLLLIVLIPFSSAISDSNNLNNMMIVFVNVSNMRDDLGLLFIRVGVDFDGNKNFEDDELLSSASFSNSANSHSNLTKAIYPISDAGITYDLDFSRYEANDLTILGSSGYYLNFGSYYSAASIAGKNYERTIAIVPDGYFLKYGDQNTHGLSTAAIPNFVMVEESETYTTAHEIGHSYGLCDESSLGEFEDDDENKEASETGCPVHDKNEDGQMDVPPCSVNGNCYLSENESNLILNLFPLADQSAPISRVINFMGGVGNHWVDLETYEYLMSIFNISNNPPQIINITHIIVIGSINKSGGKTFNLFYTITGPTILSIQDDFEQGNYTLQTKSSTGVKFNMSFNPSFKINTFGNNSVEVNSSFFIFILPSNNLTEINLFENNQLSLQRNASPNTPNVTLLVPNGGEVFVNPFNITWNASDADANTTLAYAVLISSDNGTTWSTLVFDLNQTYYEVSNSWFNYGTDYRIKILATDGVNTGVAISNSSFTIIPPPSVLINSLDEVYSLGSRKVYEAIIENDGGQNLDNLQFKLNTGISNITNAQNITLIQNEKINLLFDVNYSTGGWMNVTFFTYDNNKLVNDTYSGLFFVGDLRMGNFNNFYSNGTRRVFEALLSNQGNQTILSSRWGFNSTNGTISSNLINISAYESVFVFIENNFNNSGTYNVNINASNTFSTDTAYNQLIIPDLVILNFSIINQTDNSVIFYLNITNLLNKIVKISYRLDTGIVNLSNSSTSIFLDYNQSYAITRQYNYSRFGEFTPKLSVFDNYSHTKNSSINLSMNELSIISLDKLTSNGSQVNFEFIVTNLFATTRNMTWSFNTNNSVLINSTISLNLPAKDNLTVLLKYNFSALGNYQVIAIAKTNLSNYTRSLNISV